LKPCSALGHGNQTTNAAESECMHLSQGCNQGLTELEG